MIRPPAARPLSALVAAVLTACAPRVAPPSAAPRAGGHATLAHATLAHAGGRFALHSDPWLNLHHFLYATARARAGRDATRATITAALGDTAGFGARTPEERRAWESAVAHYVATYAARDAVFDDGLVRVKQALVALGGAPAPHGPGIDPLLADVLARAAPVYRAVWWPRHDAANRAWVSALVPLLERHGDALARGLADALGAAWPTAPLRVDVAAYANWAGAYTTNRPEHVVISSLARANQGTLGLEILFHEASHTLDDSLAAAVRAAAAASGRPAPRDLPHAILFYTAGELTRRAVPGHVPYAESEGLWSRGRWGTYLPVIRRHWRPRLDGGASLHEAARDVVRGL